MNDPTKLIDRSKRSGGRPASKIGAKAATCLPLLSLPRHWSTAEHRMMRDIMARAYGKTGGAQRW